MNILQVIYSLSQGGAERFVVNLSNELAEKGHQVTLCTFRDDEAAPTMSFNRQFLNEKVRYVNLKISTGFSIKKIKRVEDFVKETEPDIIHCH
ncbi:glycosyltransferase, partial [uncultured Parabacteroides sp.]